MIKEEVCGIIDFQLECLYAQGEKEFNTLRSSAAEWIHSMLRQGYYKFIVGMEGKSQVLLAEYMLELKKSMPALYLECAIPYEEHVAHWGEELRDRYFAAVQRCDKERLICSRKTEDSLWFYNRYLIDRSSQLLAIADSHVSRVQRWIEYAQGCGCSVWNLCPRQEGGITLHAAQQPPTLARVVYM